MIVPETVCGHESIRQCFYKFKVVVNLKISMRTCVVCALKFGTTCQLLEDFRCHENKTESFGQLKGMNVT